MNFKENFIKIIKKQVREEEERRTNKGDEDNTESESVEDRPKGREWVRIKVERDRMLQQALEAIRNHKKGDWVEQLCSLIRDIEENPEWTSTLNKLQLGNGAEFKRLTNWKEDFPKQINYLRPVAILLGLMSGEDPMTLWDALEEATKPGKKYAKYKWNKTDIRRMEGEEDEKGKEQQEVEHQPPRQRRRRGEAKTIRVMKTLSQALDNDNIVLKANGRYIRTLSEANLDRNGVSYSSAVTRNLYTPGNTTTEVHFFKKSLTTTFKKEPQNIDERITDLLREGKSIDDAKLEILRKLEKKSGKKKQKKGDEKEEKEESFYMTESGTTSKTGKPINWRKCNICARLTKMKWEIQDKTMQRHLRNFHEKSLKLDMLEVKREQTPERRKRNERLVKQLTPVIKIQHTHLEDKRKGDPKEPLEADIRYKRRYIKEAEENI